MEQSLSFNQRLFSHISKTVKRSFFGKARDARLKDFIFDVLAVVCGLRTSLLVDIFFLESEEIEEFIKALNDCEPDIYALTSQIRGLQFSDSYTFICQLKLLREQVEIGLDSYMIIDASAKLKQPQLLETDRRSEVSSSLNDFIEKHLVPFLSSSHLVLYMSKLPPVLITFTGWLLSYPAAYYQTGDTQTNENCLSNEPLTLFRVAISPPSDITLESKGVGTHILMSFSVPSNLQLDDIIQTRLTTKINHRIQKQPFWKRFEVVISQVLLPSISL